MAWETIIWDDLEGGNVDHIAEHGLTMEDVEHVMATFDRMERSRSSECLLIFGWVGLRRVVVAIEEIDVSTVYPVTAYEVG